MNFDLTSALHGLLGGALVGAGSLLAFATTRKIPGISGIFGRLLRPKPGDFSWRLVMILGLVAGAGLAIAFIPNAAQFEPAPGRGPMLIALAGLLVGFGTRLSGGCTSGHGVCGMGLGVRDSIVATLVFMAAGMLTVWLWNSFVA